MTRRGDVPSYGRVFAYAFLVLLGVMLWSLIAVSTVAVLAAR